jgi:hypothetical protein
MTPAALARKVRKCEVFNTVFYPVLNPSFSSLLSPFSSLAALAIADQISRSLTLEGKRTDTGTDTRSYTSVIC